MLNKKKNFIMRNVSAIFLALFFALASCQPAEQIDTGYDIVVYGGTSAGIAAAIQASRMNKSVLLIAPSGHLGGLTSGGLGQTDIGNKQAIGGISREFYREIKAYYEDPANWRWEEPSEYQSGGQSRTLAGEDAMWTFEPSAASRVFQKMMAKEQIDVQAGTALRSAAVKDGKVTQVILENGATFSGKMFIDASYEGGLMAAAGVSYTVGREANSVYGETYNGVQLMDGHQFPDGVDPYIVPGDPESGLLWGISDAPLGETGSGDTLVQAYNFRVCLTDHPDNRVPISRPEGYDSTRYELLVRLFAAQPDKRSLQDYFIWSRMPNRKTDINNRGAFSTDMIGANYSYPEAGPEERRRLQQLHEEYTKGLFYFLATSPRVPQELQNEMKNWGYPEDEYTAHGNWSPQLYVREARRMVGAYVMTQANCVGDVAADGPIGLAAYTMDSHNCQRIVVNGQVKNEGNVEIHGFPPYPIAYKAILPKAGEAANLLVPVCLSASHIAFGSIRMEPVFMILAQSAATAAALAIDEGVSLQALDYARLKEKLQADGQILANEPSEGR